MKKKSKKIRKSISFFKPVTVRSKKTKQKTKEVSFINPKFPPYLTSHTNPNKLRKYVAGQRTLVNMDKTPFHAWGKPKSMPKKDMTWPQAKIRFPLLKPMKDADRDGVINLLDCKPFDRKRQGFGHQYSFSFSDYPHTRTVRMTPNEFLKRTWEEGGRTAVYAKRGQEDKKVSLQEYKKQLKDYDKGSVDYLKKKIKSRKEKVAVGFIEMREGKPSGHEGRHTALAAEEEGIKEIPVTVETSEEQDVEKYEQVRENLQARYAQKKHSDDYDKSREDYEEEPIEFPSEEETQDYDLKDEDDKTLDYDEEQAPEQEEK